MLVVHSYAIAVIMTFITMLCWGSWANMQKMVRKTWHFQLFYWDFSIGILLTFALLAFTIGSYGRYGQPFLFNLNQAALDAIAAAFFAGVLWNLGNLLLVTGINIAGMAVAFPIGVGVALILGVSTNYIKEPVGNPWLLFTGVALLVTAMLLDAKAYKSVAKQKNKNHYKGIIIPIMAGCCLGFVIRIMMNAISLNFDHIAPGKMTPYSACVVFGVGVFLSNFIWNTFLMKRPVTGEKVAFRDYFVSGKTKEHLISILGGIVWGIGFCFSMISAGAAGFAISDGLGQGATMVAAFWGVFLWKEFQNAPKSTNKILTYMFCLYILGIVVLIVSRYY